MTPLTLVIAGYLLTAAEPVAAQQASRDFPVEAFDRIVLRGVDDAVVRVGSKASVSVTGPVEALNTLLVEVVGGELRLIRKGNSREWDRASKAVFTITVPRLTAVSVHGTGDLSIDRVEAARFRAVIAGAGDLSIGELRADGASLSIKGAGDVRVAGAARNLSISIIGAGNVDAGQMRAERASISITGGGEVRAGVTEQADISVLGGGSVDVTGGGKCRVRKLGGASVTCLGGTS